MLILIHNIHSGLNLINLSNLGEHVFTNETSEDLNGSLIFNEIITINDLFDNEEIPFSI